MHSAPNPSLTRLQGSRGAGGLPTRLDYQRLPNLFAPPQDTDKINHPTQYCGNCRGFIHRHRHSQGTGRCRGGGCLADQDPSMYLVPISLGHQAAVTPVTCPLTLPSPNPLQKDKSLTSFAARVGASLRYRGNRSPTAQHPVSPGAAVQIRNISSSYTPPQYSRALFCGPRSFGRCPDFTAH